MKAWLLVLLASGWPGTAPSCINSPEPALNALRHVGETTLFSFVTARGKIASLCEGPKGRYLVYRFGTAAHLELQYPAVLDARSWRRFTYLEYHRGGGAHNAGRDTHQLSFSVGKTTYELVDETLDVYSRKHGEVERRQVGIWVGSNGQRTFIAGKEASADWYLQLDEVQRKRVIIAGLPAKD